jgi:hypothetical protein
VQPAIRLQNGRRVSKLAEWMTTSVADTQPAMPVDRQAVPPAKNRAAEHFR